ncbi:hypothetical protein ACHAWF_005998 [Thalassiosira exigua]
MATSPRTWLRLRPLGVLLLLFAPPAAPWSAAPSTSGGGTFAGRRGGARSMCRHDDPRGHGRSPGASLQRGGGRRPASTLPSAATSTEASIDINTTGASAAETGTDAAAAADPSEAGSIATGSTAIILNVNARSVTPELASIASEIVGSDNVFVTRTREDAAVAARAIVRGREGPRKYSLVVPVGGDGTLSGWIDTMVDEILLLRKLEEEEEKNDDNATDVVAAHSIDHSVEEAVRQLPLVGYLPMGTGNGLGYVVGCKAKERSGLDIMRLTKKRKVENAKEVMRRLKEVGDAAQAAEAQSAAPDNLAEAVEGKCSLVSMPLMEVTHPDPNATTSHLADDAKGDLCFFAGAGFDSLMLHDFQAVKAWSSKKTSLAAWFPRFARDALSSVAGYTVALVARTLPRALKHGTHEISVTVTTEDEEALWVDHRRGDFSEPAVRGGDVHGIEPNSKGPRLVYAGKTGIVAASTTPFYGGGMRLFPYARLFPDRLQLRLGRISPLVGFLNIPKIFEGSYRERGERSFGCLDFVGTEFGVEVRGGRYEEYVKRKWEECEEKKTKRKRRWLPWRRRQEEEDDDDDDEEGDCGVQGAAVGKGFPFQHSGESMGVKERFRLRVVKEPVRFVTFLEPRVVVDD